MFPDAAPEGVSTDATKGTFKGANDFGKGLPAGGATVQGAGTQEKKAMFYSMRHSTKGLGGPKPFTAKVKPITNVGKSIGRKRGY